WTNRRMRSGYLGARPGPYLRRTTKRLASRQQSSTACWQRHGCPCSLEPSFLNTSAKNPPGCTAAAKFSYCDSPTVCQCDTRQQERARPSPFGRELTSSPVTSLRRPEHCRVGKTRGDRRARAEVYRSGFGRHATAKPWAN